MAYEKPERFPCPFCECNTGRIPSAIVFESEHAISFMAVNRRSTGAVLVTPKRHVEQISDLTPAESLDVMEILQKTAKSVYSAYGPDAIHSFCNAGIRAGQSVCHMHFQIQTRFNSKEYSFAPSIDIPWIAVDELRQNAERIKSAAPDLVEYQPKFTTPDAKMEEFTSPMTRLKEDGVLISESEHFYAVTAEYSRVKGAIVILPKRQVSNYLELSVEESNDLMLHVRKLARATEKAYDPIGLSVWWETGTEADQFFDHLVVEITPYFEDIEYKYQPRSELTQTPLEHRQSWTQHIIKHLEP